MTEEGPAYYHNFTLVHTHTHTHTHAHTHMHTHTHTHTHTTHTHTHTTHTHTHRGDSSKLLFQLGYLKVLKELALSGQLQLYNIRGVCWRVREGGRGWSVGGGGGGYVRVGGGGVWEEGGT